MTKFTTLINYNVNLGRRIKKGRLRMKNKDNKNMEKCRKNLKKLLQTQYDLIIIKLSANNVKKIAIELESGKNSDQSDLFVFNSGQAFDEERLNDSSYVEKKDVVKDREMETINILDAANFVIQLYYKTTRVADGSTDADIKKGLWDNKDKAKYRCTCTHIEKLLVIANIIAFNNKKALFEQDMLVNKCGVGIPILRDFYYSTIIDGVSDNELIDKNNINFDANFPSLYELRGKMDVHSEEILTDVFLHFGAYDAGALGKMFDEFKCCIAMPNFKDENHPLISLELAKEYFQTADVFENVKQNEIFKYIKSFTFKQ